MNKKAFIFDLDGVIVDTAKFHFVAWQRLAASLDINFTEEENEQLKGVSRVNSLKKILEWGNKEVSPEVFQAKMDQKNEEYLELIKTLDVNDILPGVHDFLLELKAKEQPIALGSASKNARPILEKLGIKDLFDVIVDGTNVTKAKPDPEVFLNACDQLGYNPQASVVFEDSVAGVQAANTAGMISIGLGDQSILNEADEVFAHFTDMPQDYINILLSKNK
ncbi:beta-phosphoglucomutase [Nonlabens dokdonensis]|jgi:beta-phosphoglucomutase|uniref:Beta-phosphoglucomutase n=2 Tax=Nonlabens dokdonensis TaxID=328515 RepID=L7W7I2_NONDD|nr:beta-phosphoglucomutase [Nonlabens dokdonensis]AGC76109.1 beta-phosphoglucomutase [Nonlabens dokdonensis DSW-6]PZX43780.1 beta-phosphoglucomutase [Nonlabens dokdonensis]